MGITEILKQKKALILDMDGTMLDLESLNYEGYKKTVKSEFSIDLSAQDYQTYFAGTQTHKAFKSFLDGQEIESDTDSIDDLVKQFRNIKGQELKENMDNVVKLKPGLIRFLEHAQSKGKKLAVATSTVRRFALPIIRHFDLEKFFDQILTANDIERSKPHPEIFLTALDKLNETAKNAVVFEYSKNGIAATKAAGILCIGIHTKGLNDESVKTADIVIENFLDIQNF
jgi:beta-phosphoglucomutase